MYTNINSPREMFERACYIFSIFSFIAGVFLTFGALVSLELIPAIFGSGSLAVALAIRHVGNQWLNFPLIERQLGRYDNGGPDSLQERIIQLQVLFEELETAPMEWRQRLRLRRRIVSILCDDERLMRHFAQRLRLRHPYMFNAF